MDSPGRHDHTLLGRARNVPLGAVLLVLVAYVPLLLTKPGRVGADTKTYLYLDPGRLLSRAASMWDPNIGLGTVTHQNIGYLWPMGPYYWVLDAIGLPDWVAQRLWLGTIIAAAGLGMRWMLRELRWEGTGVTVASFAYALSPYLLHYGARISVILLPFAGLPWLIGLASRSLRRGGWRAPAAFALVTLTVGGVNATSLLLVMVAPVLWFVHATFVAREVPLRQALAAGARISLLTLITSFWWMAGLAVQGTYGIPILRYTETYYVVANAALAPELLRGLGYWFFYGRDALGPWIQAAVTKVESLWSLALSFAVPLVAFASGLLTRFRHRGYFALVALVGVLIGVGAHPWTSSSPAGAAFKAWTRSDAGLAFRSTPRAVPLVALGLAVMLGAGAAAVARARPGWHLWVTGALLAAICVNSSALFAGQMVDRNLLRDEEVPRYWTDAAAALDTGDHGTRVLEVPGADFASYRWGNTVDPVTPGLMDRPFVARELIPYGTPAAADLLNDWDITFQHGRSDPDAIAPIARILGVGDILHRADLQYERFRTPRPRLLEQQLRSAPGLGGPTGFGPARPNTPVPSLPMEDEMELGAPAGFEDPSPVSVFAVEDPRPILRTVSAEAPILLAGDGAGIVGLASAGRLSADRPVFTSATFADSPDDLRSIAAEPGAELVVSDTNRRQARRWGSVRENDGYTERAGEEPLVRDPADNRLDVFPDAGDDATTVSEQVGGATLAASGYGNPVSYTPSDRAARAFDGDPTTAWRVGAFEPVDGEYLRIRLDRPVTTDRIRILQAQTGGNRWITRASLRFDGGAPVAVDLDDSSRTPPGQELRFDRRTFRTLRITVEGTNLGLLPRYVGVSDVGIAEVGIPGVDPVVEVVRPPLDLLRAVGEDAIDRPLTYLFQRRSSHPAEVVVSDEEGRMLRRVVAPDRRTYTPYGKARLSATLADEAVDELVGLAGSSAGGLDASSDDRLAGDLRSRAASAVDGDESTAWQGPLNSSGPHWIEVRTSEPVTVDRLPLTVVADGRHSIPTRVRLDVDGVEGEESAVPPVAAGEGRPRGATTTVEVPIPEVTGTAFRLNVTDVDPVRSIDWFGGGPTDLPVGIAELDLGVRRAMPAASTPLPERCRDDLVSVDGQPVAMRVVGTVGDAVAGNLLHLESCGGPVAVPAGSSLLETASGSETGIDVDLLALSSAPGGGPGADTVAVPADDGPEPPRTSTRATGRLTSEVDVSDAREPYWVVLGQSWSPGWKATVAGDGEGVDLGEPVLVNGFGNAWRVDPADVGADATIELEWTPQRVVTMALWASLVGVLVCVALLIRPPRRGARSGNPVLGAVMSPHGTGPVSSDGPTLSAGRAASATLAVGVASWLAAGPWVGLFVAVVAALALTLRRGQLVLRVACFGSLAAAAGYIVAKQALNAYVIDFDWMNKFEVTHAWGLTAILLLALDPLVAHLRSGQDART